MGQARPATDLYALGMSLVFALSGKAPEQLPLDAQTGGVDVRAALPGLSPRLLGVIEGMVAPVVGARTASARAAIGGLDGAAASQPATASGAPAGRGARLLAVMLLAMIAATIAAFLALRRPVPLPDAPPTTAAADPQHPAAAPAPPPPSPEVPAAPPVPAAPRVAGAPMTRDEVSAVLRAKTNSIPKMCWNPGPSTARTVKETVHLVISNQGQVTQATATGNDAAVGKCIETQVRTWTFPGPGTVDVPFRFVSE
jgi:hypothetical protein